MKTEDAQRSWHQLESVQPYDVLSVKHITAKHFLIRQALLMSQVPWIGELSRWFPVGNGLKAFRTYAINRAIERKAEGSHHKDLFYHLVRVLVRH